MKDHQTPQKGPLRSSDIANRRSKESQLRKSQNIARKSLNAAFTSFSEDISPQITNDLTNFSPISEVSDANYNGDLTESFALALNPALSSSSETFTPNDLIPSPTISTDKDELGDIYENRYGLNKLEGLKISSVEADTAENLLRQARSRVLCSFDADTQSKKLLDALIEIVIDEFYNLPEERDWFAKLVLVKAHIGFLCFLLWILAMVVILFFSCGVKDSFNGPLPT